jgi:hypothetical protein
MEGVQVAMTTIRTRSVEKQGGMVFGFQENGDSCYKTG